MGNYHDDDVVVTLRQEPAESIQHDGCNGCEHEDKPLFAYPCSSCKWSYADKYEKKEE